MSSSPECIKCGDYFYHGQSLCPKCSEKLLNRIRELEAELAGKNLIISHLLTKETKPYDSLDAEVVNEP